MVDQVVGAQVLDQVAGAQVVVDQVNGAQVLDQVARVQVVVDQVAGAQVLDQEAGAQVVVNQVHTCQPSRIRRDSPAFSSDVPRSREISRCPAFFENGIIIFFVADYSTCLPRNATK